MPSAACSALLPSTNVAGAFFFWPRPGPFQSHMQLLTVSGLRSWLLLKLERKENHVSWLPLSKSKSVLCFSKATFSAERLGMVGGVSTYNAGWREQDVTPPFCGLVPISLFCSYASTHIHLFSRCGCSGLHPGSVHRLWHGPVSSVQGLWGPGGHCSILCAQASPCTPGTDGGESA